MVCSGCTLQGFEAPEKERGFKYYSYCIVLGNKPGMLLSRRYRTTEIPQSRVELHVHLDGSLRHKTVWELSKEKGLQLPGNGTFQELREALVIRHPIDLQHFLQPFLISTPSIAGDISAIERVAYEFCEDKAKNGVLYVEARYSPHFLVADGGPLDIQALSEVVRAVNSGFARGEESFNIKVRSILCTLVGQNQASDVLELCQTFRNEGVVGIDMASPADGDPGRVEVPDTGIEVEAFQQAASLGIHRTVHAGESGSAEMVKRALELYHAERIGHGYHVLEDDEVYGTVRDRRIHLENCPWSSYLTGSVELSTPKHPVVQFAEDEVNFSISTDDPMVTGHELQGDYDLVHNYWGLTEAHLIRANFNAARSSFLPQDEKEELIARLRGIYQLN